LIFEEQLNGPEGPTLLEMDFRCVGEFAEPFKEIRTLKVQTTIFEIR
jgi:hypothetical protein